MRSFVVVCAALAALCVPQQAHAGPVLWTLAGVTFGDGAVATGSFVFDADTSVYSNILITTTDGPGLTGATYTYINPTYASRPNEIIVVDTLPRGVGDHVMNLTYSGPLTNAGGVVPLGSRGRLGIEGLCSDGLCTSAHDQRFPTGGEVRTIPVQAPEPFALSLLSPGLVVIGLRRYGQRR